MHTVISCSSAEAVAGLLDLVQAADPVVDVTYGNGTFWVGSDRDVWGGDRDPSRAPLFVADFLALPFPNRSLPTVVYDPPFQILQQGQPPPAYQKYETTESRYSGLGTNSKELRILFQAGLQECWRVTQRHLLVKCQGYIHQRKPQWMPLWAVEVLGEPFEWLIVLRESTPRVSGRWVHVRSLRRNHADYLLFDRCGNRR